MTGDLHSDPKLGRLVVISLVLHGLAVLLLGGYLERAPKPDRRPVYYVDLVHKPVLNPQAGRPEPRPAEKPKPAPVAPVKAAPPTAQSVPIEPAKPAPKVVKPAAKAAPVAPPSPSPAQAIAALREKQQRQAEIDALKNSLNQQTASLATVPKEVEVGMPDGTGTEAGSAADAYIQTFIQQNWALSPYLLDRARVGTVEARAKLVYSASGELVSFKIVKESGDSQFDDSIKRAIIKSKQLPETLPGQVERTVIFNLKEMAQARR